MSIRAARPVKGGSLSRSLQKRSTRWVSEHPVVTDLLVFAVPGIPEIAPGADLGRVIAEAARSATTSERPIESGDVFVVAQKIVSKAEDAVVRLDSVTPS